MKKYDVVVIGSGSGMEIVDKALSQGLKVALVDKGPFGGTCLNVGCIPSKLLIYPADRIAEIEDARKLGIHAKITSIDFNAIMDRMRKIIAQDKGGMEKGLVQTKGLDFYDDIGYFVDDYTLQVGDQKIQGEKIFIATGTKPLIPPIKGIDQVKYLTNDNVLDLKNKPSSIIIIGGGYIAGEYGHFFAAMGTEVTILQRNERLLPNEEPEISDLLKKEMEKRMKVFTSIEAVEVKEVGNNYTVIGKHKKTGKQYKFTAEHIMIATGRRANSDLLKVENSGIGIDNKRFIKVDEFLETTKKNIWAIGDSNGKHMFKHVANEEAVLAWYNATHDKKVKMDYWAAPHAVYSHPQIAGVGLTEQQASENYDILVGKAYYSQVAKGEAMMEEEAFAKAIVDNKTGQILGFHIVGPHAPILIQEVIQVMANKEEFTYIAKGMHIHPALSEIVLAALGNLQHAGEHHH